MKDEYYNEYRKFGLSISYFRKEKGYTQQELAEKIGVNPETISRIENANTGITMDKLLDVAKALDISLKDLFEHAKF